jgi:hypothetical protein
MELDPQETDADVLGSAARLALTGTRGFAVTFTWLSAIEKQKRNDFHEFEQRVQLVTLLQPNFISPWIYQSWNITYNVSVEMQGSGDMYFYIVRGIQLLAEGERRNKRSPDMRYQIAFYYQNKFGVSDQVEVLRCLFDLSCIPHRDRNPNNFENRETKTINYEEFKRFCEGTRTSCGACVVKMREVRTSARRRNCGHAIRKMSFSSSARTTMICRTGTARTK